MRRRKRSGSADHQAPHAHQNGIVNNQLQEHFPAANLNDEYRMTLDEFLTRVGYLVQAIDAAAGKDYQLAASS